MELLCSNTPQFSMFFERYCKSTQLDSVMQCKELEGKSVPYLAILSDPRWQPAKENGCEPIDKDSKIVVEDFVTIAKSALNIDLKDFEHHDFVREDFEKNGESVDLVMNESKFDSWTPMTPTIFGPSLIGINASTPISNQAIYSTSQQNQSFSFASLLPRNNLITSPDIDHNCGSRYPLSYSSVLNNRPPSVDSQANEPNPMRSPSAVSPQFNNPRHYCQFCKNNGKPQQEYKSHILKTQDGRVVCPLLRAYNCPLCNNGGGDFAHTIRYCRLNRPQHWRTVF